MVDPHYTNHSHISKSIKFLLNNPDEAEARRQPGPAHQPLAVFVPSLPPPSELARPLHVKLHFTDELVVALGNRDEKYFHATFLHEISLPLPKDNHIKAEDVEDAKDVEITDASIAFNIFLNADLVVGFHPDGGTEPAIDFALAR